MRSVAMVCTILRNTQAHDLAGGGSRPYERCSINTNLLSETDKHIMIFATSGKITRFSNFRAVFLWGTEKMASSQNNGCKFEVNDVK